MEQGERCDCGSPEQCLAVSSDCVPPGLRRGESECQYRQSSRPQKSSQCSRIGLKTCHCPRESNSVTLTSCSTCCRSKGEACRPAQDWTQTLFLHMQHYLARICWHGGTVLSCISSSTKWRNTLHSLSSYRPDKKGKVYCLRTQADSNCWQLDFPSSCSTNSLSSFPNSLSSSSSSPYSPSSSSPYSSSSSSFSSPYSSSSSSSISSPYFSSSSSSTSNERSLKAFLWTA